MDGLDPLPAWGAWRLEGAHEGFEVAEFDVTAARVVVRGASVGVEGDARWWFRYRIEVGPDWSTRSVEIETTERRMAITRDGDRWVVDGRREPALDGCADVDLEGSLVTNTLPVHRLDLPVGVTVDAPAVYVRTTGAVERLEQSYRRRGAEAPLRLDYESPRFGYRETLRFGPDGLVVDYPGIGRRTV